MSCRAKEREIMRKLRERREKKLESEMTDESAIERGG